MEGAFVEIGSFAGESTSVFLQHFSRIVCVDPYIAGYDQSDVTSRRLAKDLPAIRAAFAARTAGRNVSLLEMTSADAAKSPLLPSDIDVVYIDGCHVYNEVKGDLLRWLPLLRRPGVICGHDYGALSRVHGQDVMRAVQEVLGDPDETFVDSSWSFFIK